MAKQLLVTRALVRWALSESAAEIPPDVWQFADGEHGKPASPDAADLQFNLSHSHEAGLVAVLRGVRVGVDVELARPGRRFTGLAGKFFSAAENQALLGLAEAKQRQAFYRAWVRKEAYLKAWGTGLSFPSNRFTLSFLAGEPSRLIDSEMPGDDPAAQACNCIW